jgi:hypothetical protein
MELIFLIQPYMFRAKNSPILRSTFWLYIHLLVQCSDTAADRCHGWDGTNLFNSALHVSGDKFAHPQEHFLSLYAAFGTMHRHCCRPVPRLRWNSMEFHLNSSTGRQQCRYIVPKAAYTVKKCSWGWANLSPEICRAELNRLINEKSCWIFLVIYIVVLKWCTVT